MGRPIHEKLYEYPASTDCVMKTSAVLRKTLDIDIQLFAWPVTGKPVPLSISEFEVVGIAVEVDQSPPRNEAELAHAVALSGYQVDGPVKSKFDFVGVGVRVLVGVGVFVLVGVTVGVGVFVLVGVTVGVTVGVKVFVGVIDGVTVGVFVGVTVGVTVFVGVGVGVVHEYGQVLQSSAPYGGFPSQVTVAGNPIPLPIV